MANANSVYRAKKATALGNVTSATVFKQSDDSTKAAFVQAKDIVSGKPFRLRASGTATTGTTSNFKATIQFNSDITSTSSTGTAATAANNTDYFALTNRSYVTVTRFWEIDVEAKWDSVSGRLTGQSNGFNAETIETANAAITALTSVDFSTNKCGFVVSAIFGTSNASNACSLVDFSLEVL